MKIFLYQTCYVETAVEHAESGVLVSHIVYNYIMLMCGACDKFNEYRQLYRAQ